MASAEGNASVPKGVVNVALILFVWSLLTYFVRGWVKRRAWAPDDTVISVALLFILAHVIAITKASGYGFPLPWSELDTQDRVQASKMLYVAQIFYVLSLGAIKVASGIFNTRLTLDPGNALIATCLTAGCGIWTIASLLVIAIRGNLAEPWLTYNGSYTMYLRWMGVEIVGNLLDLTMWALSTYFIARLNMKKSRKVYLSAIFGCRLIIIPFTILRLISLSPSRNLNQDAPPVAANIFGELAVNGAFIAASITCLKPFLRPFDMGYTHTSRANDISGGIKNSRGDTYYMLSATRSTNNDKNYSVIASRLSERGTERSISAPTPTFRPAGHKSRATVESHEYVPDNRGTLHPPMTISMTKEWDVKYEEDRSIRNEAA